MDLKSSLLYSIIRTLRPRQWLKNLSILAAPFLWGSLLEPPPHTFQTLSLAFRAVLIFCMASSAAYLINDVVDAPKDRAHPIKKDRPIASGKLPEKVAILVAGILTVASIGLAVILFNRFFVLTVVAFLALQVSYSLYLRKVIIIDALTVASGFVLRVFAGTFATNAPISSWLVLATIGLSMLLAFGKRRSERTILSSLNIPMATRETLKHYPDTLLDSMISMSATFSIVSYALYSFQASPTFSNRTFSENLPSTLAAPKLMMLTIPIVIYGVARYLYVIYEKKEGESPERVLLSDAPLLNAVLVWAFSILIIIYGIFGSQGA